mmetsp:Transcript_11678/g.33046  ORF Transcript_11678/g.33046 Transcript_11678/m.33046 type:complete len:267 (-) Transcript_11678:135-935(-)
MARPPPDFFGQGLPDFFGQGAPDTATPPLAGRELPADLVQQVSGLTMGQLFHILGHIQKLSAQAPVTTQALLAENPQICCALLHAECLAGMVEEPLLPMTSDELRRAKAKARQMQEELADHQLPPPEAPGCDPAMGSTAKAMMSGAPISKFAGRARPSAAAPPKSAPFPGGAAASAPFPTGPPRNPSLGLPPTLMGGGGAPGPMPSPGPIGGGAPFARAAPTGESEEQKQHLMQKLVQLTPEQISKLPEHTKVQLLQFLQQHSQQT